MAWDDAAMTELPTRARVVVIGGGVIGCSVAYHLAHMGWNDVVLVERDQLTSGTTWHAAGLMVTFGSTSETSTEMRKYTRDLYAAARGRDRAGDRASSRSASSSSPPTPTGSRSTGGCAAFNRYCGVDVQEISAAEVAEMFPLARTDDILAGFYVADDGRVNPVDVTMALAQGRPPAGRDDRPGRHRHGVLTHARRGHRRRHRPRHIEAEYVVNCAGMWARQLGARSGVNDPAAGGRALLPDHRADRGPRSVVAGDRGSRLATATTARRSAG